MFWIALFNLLLAVLAPPVNEEALFFDVILKGEVVGELKAVKTTSGTQTIYQSITEIETRLITKLQVSYNTRVVYVGEAMQEAKASLTVNGSTFTDTHTKRVNGEYHFYKSEKQKKKLDSPITFSSIQLLFEEPERVASAYSEDSGSFFTIERKEKNMYEKVNSRGKKSIYHYRNKALESIEVDAGPVEFEMVLKK